MAREKVLCGKEEIIRVAVGIVDKEGMEPVSVRRIAKELGVSYATICRWEKDNREPQIVSQGKFYAFCESKGIKFEE